MQNLRDKMVEEQIKARGITDARVLEAMKRIPRHEFVPGQIAAAAYEDHPLQIGHNQTISQPYIVACMTEQCKLRGEEKVLEIGTGSGYQTAVLSLLCKEVYTVERIPVLLKSAEKKLSDYKNIFFKIGDGYEGWKEHAPFDVIVLTASPPEIPRELMEQLSAEGRLIAPEGDEIQKLVRVTRSGIDFQKETVTYVRFVPMVRGIDTK